MSVLAALSALVCVGGRCDDARCQAAGVSDPGGDAEIASLVVGVGLGILPASEMASALRTLPCSSSKFRKLAAHLSMAGASFEDGVPSISVSTVTRMVDALVDALVRLPAEDRHWRMEAYATGEDVTAFNLMRAIRHGATHDAQTLLPRLNDLFGVIARRIVHWQSGPAGVADMMLLLVLAGQATVADSRRSLISRAPKSLDVLAAVYANDHMRTYHPQELSTTVAVAWPAMNRSPDGMAADMAIAGRLRSFLAQSGLAKDFARTVVRALEIGKPGQVMGPYDVALTLVAIVGDKTNLTTGHIRTELLDAGLLPIIARMVRDFGLHKPDEAFDSDLRARACYSVSGWFTEMRFELGAFRTLVDHGYIERLALSLCSLPELYGAPRARASALTVQSLKRTALSSIALVPRFGSARQQGRPDADPQSALRDALPAHRLLSPPQRLPGHRQRARRVERIRPARSRRGGHVVEHRRQPRSRRRDGHDDDRRLALPAVRPPRLQAVGEPGRRVPGLWRLSSVLCVSPRASQLTLQTTARRAARARRGPRITRSPARSCASRST